MVQRVQMRVEELLHQCDECVSALNRTRIELQPSRSRVPASPWPRNRIAAQGD
jgi:hypothetical protein